MVPCMMRLPDMVVDAVAKLEGIGFEAQTEAVEDARSFGNVDLKLRRGRVEVAFTRDRGLWEVSCRLPPLSGFYSMHAWQKWLGIEAPSRYLSPDLSEQVLYLLDNLERIEQSESRLSEDRFIESLAR